MPDFLQFGEHSFDCQSNSLSRNGHKVRLQAQPALALRHLLLNPNRIVSREEFRQVLWGAETFVDFDKGLNFCIAQIRLALRDDASRPIYIRTIPKHGYELIATVRSAQSLESGRAKTRSGRRKLQGYMSLAIVSVCAIVAVSVFAYRLTRRRPHPPNLAVLRFDADSNEIQTQMLADRLTDDVVGQLTSESHDHYRVIGNAPPLRAPRDQRNLREIGSSLSCSYAVLGQVQSDGDQTVVLAHLIRLSDLTHIWVVRVGPLPERQSLADESRIATHIAVEISIKMAESPELAASFGTAMH